MLRKIECFLTPCNLDRLRAMLQKKDIEGMSVSQVKGLGVHSKIKDGSPEIEDRLKVEIVVSADAVQEVVSGIANLADAREIGTGRVFVIPVESCTRLVHR